MNKLPPSGIDFVFKISGNFSFLDGLILRYFTFRVAKFLAYIGCSNHFFYTNRHRIIHIIYHTITCHLKTLETLDRWCFKQTFLTFYPQVLYQNRRTCCFLFIIHLHVQIVKIFVENLEKITIGTQFNKITELILAIFTNFYSWQMLISVKFVGRKAVSLFRFMITSRFLIFITSLALINFSKYFWFLNDNLRSYRWTVSGTS